MSDPYVEYTRRFFGRWVGVYDLFAFSIAWIYGAAVRAVGARPGAKVLDLCSGTGEIALRCAAAGAAVTALDLTPAMLGRARAKAAARALPVRFEIGDARALPFADSAFDTAVISFGLHDMPRRAQEEVLREAGRVARRIVVLDYDLPRSRWLARLAEHAIALFETPYFRAFARQRVEPLLPEAGLEAVRIRRLKPPLFALWELRGRGEGAAATGSASGP